MPASPDREAIAAIQKRHDARLMRLPNVVGTGIGYRRRGGKRGDALCLVVLVKRKLPTDELAASALLPRQLEGAPVDVQEIGDLSA